MDCDSDRLGTKGLFLNLQKANCIQLGFCLKNEETLLIAWNGQYKTVILKAHYVSLMGLTHCDNSWYLFSYHSSDTPPHITSSFLLCYFNFVLPYHRLFLFNSCVPCDPSCQTCFGDGVDQCLSCSRPNLLLGSTCITECPKGMFHSQVTHTCEACHATCELCSGPTYSDCDSCKGKI